MVNRRTKRRGRQRPRRPGHFSLLLLLATVLLVWARYRAERRIVAIAGLAPGTLAGVTVVVDPGHGGQDPGAVRAGVTEASVTHRTAAILAIVLRAAGADVRLTLRSRTLDTPLHEGGDEPPLEAPLDARFAIDGEPVRRRSRDDPEDLYRRSAVARQAWRQRRSRVFFVSLHYDAARNPQARGGHVCFDRRGGAPPPLARAIGRWMAHADLDGNRVQALSPRELGVLNPTHNPVPDRVLVELATLSHDGDRQLIQTAAWRWNVARLLARAIAESVTS